MICGLSDGVAVALQTFYRQYASTSNIDAGKPLQFGIEDMPTLEWGQRWAPTGEPRPRKSNNVVRAPDTAFTAATLKGERYSRTRRL
ncbi:helicase domain protein [Bradyrhizobium oligotrophicum S58]|uniref:Helicase domain protein n=1 Tax=Bradyrhizobium oligotrophicum S58 TaxID=1245469 RepID=M4Z9I6_9BRAD|nr:helicase domain protein [Bradyrhizobium oligotrophicum S58]